MSHQLTPEQLAEIADTNLLIASKFYATDAELRQIIRSSAAMLSHIEARELAFKEALEGLLHLPTREELTGEPSSYDGESRDEAEADYQALIRAAAAKLNITLD